MGDRLLVAVLGNRNSGKSTTWNRLFDATVKTGKHQRPLYLNHAQSVEVFLVSGSPEERELDVGDILTEPLPQIVLCSTQYREDVKETFNYFFANGYE
jgi:septin family protein